MQDPWVVIPPAGGHACRTPGWSSHRQGMQDPWVAIPRQVAVHVLLATPDHGMQPVSSSTCPPLFSTMPGHVLLDPLPSARA